VWHERFVLKNFRENLVERQRGDFPVHLCRNLVPELVVVEIVRKSDAISGRHGQDLVFTIAIEGSPLKFLGVSTPVKFDFSTGMTDSEFASCVCARETNHQRTELIFCPGSIHMWFKLVVWTLVDLTLAQRF
jgi:hypothetical protein